jgi:hypothetical protein
MEPSINILNEDKIYHVYIRNKCVYNCLNREQFNAVWENLNNMVGIVHTDYTKNDLSFEELKVNSTASRNSSL